MPKGLDFWSIGEFFPKYTVEDLVKVYGVVGGVPSYPSRLDSNKSFEENLAGTFFSRGGYLARKQSCF
ncbi:MAG: hypothetical protein ACTSWP_06450 [Candidatus Freyarchaeota archaeon]|nr:hypothetical protein [Candidatus Freyrarchaeum guaymaensis]